MCLSTFLILISFVSCFNLAESASLPEAMEKMMSTGRSQFEKVFEKYKEGMKTIKDVHLKGAGAKSPADDAKLLQVLESRVNENANKLTPVERLKGFSTNIDKAPILKGDKAAELKKVAQESAEVLAKEPSKWKTLWKALKYAFGGLIAGYILAAIYGMRQ
ncbi:unnamed protein product [Peronospora destructor]|uniref:RxLR effector protein n=1 Tax=Peronospora destructor TaxID=86335 RepID=A0AAV0TNB5_9STRA|nr:unnamed protein product [Peronospora destructor]